MEHSHLQLLPPELREAIYTIVLGGNNIHVELHGSDPISYSICSEAISLGTTIRTIKRHGTSKQFPEELDHFSCAKPMHLECQLLHVCKQIHREAAPLPLKANTFVLNSVVDLQMFCNILPARRRQHVMNICLVTSLTSTGFAQAPCIVGLSGLRNFTLALGVAGRETPERVRRFLTEIVEAFGRQPLASATVLIRARKHRCSEDELRLRLEQYEAWASEAETELLAQNGKE